jgi:hypothetical protein
MWRAAYDKGVFKGLSGRLIDVGEEPTLFC